jgi:hypothetical protein
VTPDCLELLPYNSRFDILIERVDNRNRSIHNDEVYVEINPVMRWKKKGANDQEMDLDEVKEEKEEEDVVDADAKS